MQTRDKPKMIQVVVRFCNSGMSNLNKAFKWLVHGYVIWMLQSISSQFSGGSIPVDLGSLVGMWWWRVVNSRTTPQRACHSGHTLVVSKWLPNLSSCRPQLLRFICPRSQHQNKTKCDTWCATSEKDLNTTSCSDNTSQTKPGTTTLTYLGSRPEQ